MNKSAGEVNNNSNNNNNSLNLILLGTDLNLADYYLGADLYISKDGDMEVSSEEMNIAQAILHRLRTIKGELADLGHPDYGSTILDFIGQPNNSVTRSRLRLAIRDTIRQEHRIKELVSIDVKQRIPDISSSRRFNKISEFELGTQKVRVLTSSSSTVTTAKGAGGDAIKKEREEEKADQGQQRPFVIGEEHDNNGADRIDYEALLLDSTDILNSVDVEIVVISVGSATPMQIGFSFNLESAATPIQIGAFPVSREVVK